MKIGIIGTGTAGILSTAFVLAYAPETIEVYSIYNPKKPILGIGESTSTQIPGILCDSIGFTLLEDSDQLDATFKLGVKFSDWRKKDFYSHIMPVSYAMHFDNHSIKEYTFDKFNQFNNFNEIHGNVDNLKNEEDKVVATIDGITHEFDYVVDCGGYPNDYSEYNMNDFISLNSCFVHNTKPENYNYTHHKATPNGWMFGIPLQSRQSWGYLYNDRITKREDAIINFKTYCDDIVTEELKEFKFKSYSAKTYFDGRILKNGNRALFYEPMEAFMGFFYERVIKSFFDFLYVHNNIPMTNESIQQIADDIENAICFIYKGGSIYNTPFWKEQTKLAKQKLKNNIKWKHQVEMIKQIKNSGNSQTRKEGVGAFPVKSWLDFDINLKYNMF